MLEYRFRNYFKNFLWKIIKQLILLKLFILPIKMILKLFQYNLLIIVLKTPINMRNHLSKRVIIILVLQLINHEFNLIYIEVVKLF